MPNLPPGCTPSITEHEDNRLASVEELAALELREQPIRDCGHHEYDSRVEPVGGKEMCHNCFAKAKWPGFNLCSCGRQFRYKGINCGACQLQQADNIYREAFGGDVDF